MWTQFESANFLIAGAVNGHPKTFAGLTGMAAFANAAPHGETRGEPMINLRQVSLVLIL